jgi:hypothetical protein
MTLNFVLCEVRGAGRVQELLRTGLNWMLCKCGERWSLGSLAECMAYLARNKIRLVEWKAEC